MAGSKLVNKNGKLYYEYKIVENDTLSLIVKKFGYKESEWNKFYKDDVNADFRKKCEQYVSDYTDNTHKHDKHAGDIIKSGDVEYIPCRIAERHDQTSIKLVTRILQAEIKQIDDDSGISAAYNKVTVQKPNWKAGDNVDDPYTPIGTISKKTIDCSKKPVVFTLKKNAFKLKVKLNISKLKNVTGDLKLTGDLDGFKYELKFKGSEGDNDLTLDPVKPPTEQKWFKGDMIWRLESVDFPDQSVKLGSTRMEIFVILDEPIDVYKPKGVWVEVLRFLFNTVGVNNIDKFEKAASTITHYFHSNHGLTYDTEAGDRHFVTVNWATASLELFEITNYMNKTGNIVNCYDQAASVQVFCGAIGIKVDWLYCNPFGFIKMTNLVGVGPCNNPFYMAKDNNTGLFIFTNLPVVPDNDPNRSEFGNHAFCGYDGNNKVFDACAKPHLGEENREDYLKSSIDTLYSVLPDISVIKTYKEVKDIV
jgi:hypothetical protein